MRRPVMQLRHSLSLASAAFISASAILALDFAGFSPEAHGLCSAQSSSSTDCESAANDGGTTTIKEWRDSIRTDPSRPIEFTPRGRTREEVIIETLGCSQWSKEFAESGAPVHPLCAPDDSTNAPASATISVQDIAVFKPATPTGVPEPYDWAVVGKQANYVVQAGPHVVGGTLFDAPAEVRYNPVGSRWEFTDGVVIEAGTLGATWEALGQDIFTRTATSRGFEARGEVWATPYVVYSAEYRINGGAWVPVAGTLTIPGEAINVRAFTAKTVLVNEDCIQNPTGIGCNPPDD